MLSAIVAGAITRSTSSPSSTSARLTNHEVLLFVGVSAAACNAKRVLPDATGADQRDERWCSSEPTMAATSRSRPTNSDRCTGRLFGKASRWTERGEVVREQGIDELPEPLGLGKVAESMQPELEQICRFRSRRYEVRGHTRQQDLPPCPTAMIRAARFSVRPRKSSPTRRTSPVWSPIRTETSSRTNALCACKAASAAAPAESNAAAMPSPIEAKIVPPCVCTASRKISKCRSTTAGISGLSSHCAVEPSMSVKRKVNVDRVSPLSYVTVSSGTCTRRCSSSTIEPVDILAGGDVLTMLGILTVACAHAIGHRYVGMRIGLRRRPRFERVGELITAGHPEFAVDAVEVGVDGAFRHGEPLGDLLAR